jgi:hypothetical protein
MQGITVVSPMWGDRKTTDRMVFSILHQYISEKNPFNIHLVLVDDYIEGRIDGKSYYECYLTDDFKALYDTEHIKISLIVNKEHKYQGESREIGYMAGDYPYFLLVDCDDMIAPNACDRYLNILKDREEAEDGKPVACIYGYLYGFDTDGYEQKITGESIWVQSRCFNRDFLVKHDIHFLTGLHSKQGEDYPFIRKLDYAINHDSEYETVRLPYNNNEDCQCTAYWFPNEHSLSRKDPYYSQHLSGWTMASSNSILDFFDDYNKKHGYEDQEDEYMKHEYLNMAVYSFYNLLDFLKTVATTEYKPLVEDWDALRDNVRRLRQRLLEKYWDEIVYSDVEDMLYQVRHYSDARFTECWFGNFYDYMGHEHIMLVADYEDMLKYCKGLKFDGAGHEIHSKQVVAWQKRHKGGKKDAV